MLKPLNVNLEAAGLSELLPRSPIDGLTELQRHVMKKFSLLQLEEAM